MMKARLLTDNMVQDIYEKLTERSERDLEKYNRPKSLPKFKIEGELVLFLDDLLEYAAEQLQLDPEVALSELVDLGIVYWYMSLDGDLRTALGLPDFIDDGEATTTSSSNNAGEHQKLKRKLATLTDELEREKKSHSEEMEKLISEKENAQSEVFQLRKKLEELNQLLDQSESDQTQSLGQNLDILSGNAYTPMTAHAFSGNTGGTNKKSTKTKRSKKKKGFGTRNGNRGR